MKLNQNIVALVFSLLIVFSIKGYFGLIDSKTQSEPLATAITTVSQSSEGSFFASQLLEDENTQHSVKINENIANYYRIVSPFPHVIFGLFSTNKILQLSNLFIFNSVASCKFLCSNIPIYIANRVLLI
jgi:hypothetical protein